MTETVCLWGPAVQSRSVLTAPLSGHRLTHPKSCLMDDEPCHLFTPLSAFLYFHRSPSILLSFFTFLSLSASSSSISAVSPHLITVALLNKCITHELIHGSFSSAPYGPTVKPRNFSKSLQICVFSTGAGGLWHDIGGYFTSPQTTVLIKHRRN